MIKSVLPASVHEISFDGVEVGCVVHTRASESGQTEEVMLQSCEQDDGMEEWMNEFSLTGKDYK